MAIPGRNRLHSIGGINNSMQSSMGTSHHHHHHQIDEENGKRYPLSNSSTAIFDDNITDAEKLETLSSSLGRITIFYFLFPTPSSLIYSIISDLLYYL